jgi:hypothetical protein
MKLASLITAIFFILPFNSFGHESKIAIGDKMADVQVQLRKLEATDISSGIEREASDNERLLKGVYWRISSFKCVVALLIREERIAAISYWSEEDFSQSKVHREASRLYAQSILFNSMDNHSSVNLLPGYELYGWSTGSANWDFSLFDSSMNRNRTVKEIQDPKSTLSGLQNLENRLAQLPVKTVIILSPMPEQLRGGGRYPPRTVVNELHHFLASKEMTLQVISND